MHKIDGAAKWFADPRLLENRDLRDDLKAIAAEYDGVSVDELRPRLFQTQFESAAAKKRAAALAPPALDAAYDSESESEVDEDVGEGARGGVKIVALVYCVLGKSIDARRAIYKPLYEVGRCQLGPWNGAVLWSRVRHLDLRSQQPDH